MNASIINKFALIKTTCEYININASTQTLAHELNNELCIIQTNLEENCYDGMLDVFYEDLEALEAQAI